MAGIIDPLPADCDGMRALAVAAIQAREVGGGLVTGVPLCSSVKAAAGIVSPRSEARGRSPEQTLKLSKPGCPLSGQNASRKKGSVTFSSSPLWLRRGLKARDRGSHRYLPGGAWLQGAW
jgi:hypothetical protein